MSAADSAADEEARLVGAIDMGSNSFHAVIARLVHREIVIVDRLKEPVRLAAGLDERKRLSPEVKERALACLERLGQRLADMEPGSVRAVGTNALRRAKNSRSFLEQAQARLGHPIEIITGKEEARLIYLGVAHTLAADDDRRLVVDIGGGSTECIIGENFEPIEADSLHMGCVSWTERFFPGGKITKERMRKARFAAALELQPIARRYRKLGWEQAVGASGTLLAIAALHTTHGWADQAITPHGLRRLEDALVQAGSISSISLDGLKAERAQVLPGGLAVVRAVFERLRIDKMSVSSGALREGVLYDLFGRFRHEDVRDRTIRALMERYHVDTIQAARVERTARACLEPVAEAWGLEADIARQYLCWAARTHEIGLAISYSGYHRHGAYLVEHGDMPGFSRDGQQMLAAMIRSHRRKLRPAVFDVAPPLWEDRALRLTLLLRLAVLLNRSRSSGPLPPFELRADGQQLRLELGAEWLERHPLTQLDLEREANVVADAGFELTFN